MTNDQIKSGGELAMMRQLAGMKAKDLAAELGISPEHLSRMEQGTKPVSRVMGLAIYTLLSRTPSHGKASGEIASKAQEIVAIANRYQGAEEDDQAPVPVDVLRAAAMIVNQAALAPMLDTMAAPIPVEGEVLEWSKNRAPHPECRYDHCTAETPFGQFRIEWKSWKDHPGYVIYFAEDFVSGQPETLDEAKAEAAKWFSDKLRECHRLTFSRGVDEVREAVKALLMAFLSQATHSRRPSELAGEFYPLQCRFENNHNGRVTEAIMTEAALATLLADFDLTDMPAALYGKEPRG